jgi:hypothetical protein
MLEQHSENAKGLFRETDWFRPVLAQLTGAKVKLKAFETDKSLGGVNCHCTPFGGQQFTTDASPHYKLFE